jgi:hypothetical protein
VGANFAIWERQHSHEKTTTYTIKRPVLDDTYPATDLDQDFAQQGKNGVGFHIRGHCPACFHPTSAVVVTRYLAEKQMPAVDSRDRCMYTTLKCACIFDHQNAATTPFGCGAEWMLRVSYKSHPKNVDPQLGEGGPIVRRDRPLIEIVSQAEAQYRWASADANGAAIPTSLMTFQAAAGKWQTALTALVALVGVGSLLTGRTTVQACP